jgi:hypothetical protein
MSPESFRQELQRLMPNGDLRLSRDPRRLLMNLWVVERRVPRQEYVEGLARLHTEGQSRYVHVDQAGVGCYYDTSPEWQVVHVCKTTRCSHDLPIWHGPECYREPDMRDVQALHSWLYEFRDFEHSMVELRRERQNRQDALDREESFVIRKELRSSKDFRQLVYSMPGDGTASTTERIEGKIS